MPKFYFISDCHLGVGSREQDKAREERLLMVLRQIESEAASGEAAMLFIVGDLFDSWFEYRQVVPRRHIRTIAMLANIRKYIPVEYLMGNHDFGHRNYFRDELGIEIYPGDIRRTLGGKKFYIAHGDGKALHDTGYLILRKILRNPFLLWCFSWIHPDIGISIAEWMSGSSRGYTDRRDALQKQDGLKLFAEKKIAEGFDYVIMGHRHKPERTPIGSGTYINLGDWLNAYSYGMFDGVEFHLLTAPETSQAS